MNGKDILTALSGIDAKYVSEAEYGSISGGGESAPVKSTRRSRPMRRPLLIAALIALTLLLVGCAVVYALNLRDLKVGQSTVTRYNLDPQSNQVTPTELTMDVISLQGIQGSPNFLAAREWCEFEQSYDPEQKLIDNSFVYPGEYEGYDLYNQEMADKVTELCEKYSLKPLGKTVRMQNYQFDVLYEALGMESLFREGAQLKDGVGYFTEYGNFNLMVQFTLTSAEAQHKDLFYATMRYVGKEYFDTMNAVVDSIGSTENWNYTLADGTQVLLVQNEKSALILCDRSDAFLSVFLEAYDQTWKTISLAKRDIELAAEGLNFTVKPQQPDMSQVDRMLAEAEQAHQEAMAAVSSDPEDYVDPEICDSYGALLASSEFIRGLKNDAQDGLYYSLVDINGDGTEELLVGIDQDSFSLLYTMEQGKTRFLHSGGSSSTDYLFSRDYLCEDGIIEIYALHISAGGAFEHCYERFAPEEKEDILPVVDVVRYNAVNDRWYSRPDPMEDEKEISGEEAQAILASHPRVALDMKPISEFPAE